MTTDIIIPIYCEQKACAPHEIDACEVQCPDCIEKQQLADRAPDSTAWVAPVTDLSFEAAMDAVLPADRLGIVQKAPDSAGRYELTAKGFEMLAGTVLPPPEDLRHLFGFQILNDRRVGAGIHGHVIDDHEALTFHPTGGIGDINSDAKGSGARYNTGKAPFDLVPLSQVAASYLRDPTLPTAYNGPALALSHLGEYQARTRGVDALYDALDALGLDGWKECAEVFDYGQRKYKAFNWCKGMAWSIPIACAARHIILGIMAGENIDPESGRAHRGHVYCNVVMLIAYAETFLEGDDRPAAGLLARAA